SALSLVAIPFPYTSLFRSNSFDRLALAEYIPSSLFPVVGEAQDGRESEKHNACGKQDGKAIGHGSKCIRRQRYSIRVALGVNTGDNDRQCSHSTNDN